MIMEIVFSILRITAKWTCGCKTGMALLKLLFNFDSKSSLNGIFQALFSDLVLIGTSSLKLALVLLSSTLLKLQTRSGFLLQTVIVSTDAWSW